MCCLFVVFSSVCAFSSFVFFSFFMFLFPFLCFCFRAFFALASQVLASLIYSASALHAAVNFPQKPRVSFVPNTPGSVYAPPPTDKVRITSLGYRIGSFDIMNMYVSNFLFIET